MSQTLRPWYRARTPAALGAAVQGARQSVDLNQDELALQAGTSRPTLSRLERGLPVSTSVLLEALATSGYELVVVPRGARLHLED
jgi:transcriptional regulator with XRE-family HTH domain